MKKTLVLICIFLFSIIAKAQIDGMSVVFNFKYGSFDLKLNEQYTLNEKDSIQITALKFYVSNISLLKDDKVVWTDVNGFHLVDAELPSSKKIILNTGNLNAFDQISFSLGIDSMTNVSGAQGGDLDPIKGMYWAWQSGYINLKLEGTSNLCITRKNEFKFHLGGYLYPNNSLPNLSLKVDNNKNINVNIDIEKIIQSTNLLQHEHIMSPRPEAVPMLHEIATQFRIQN